MEKPKIEYTLEEGQEFESRFKEEARVIYNELLKSPEIEEALDILDRLPENLTYHAKEHTLDVIQETILFALADGASPEAIKQQAISAAWHDTGFVEKKDGKGHEVVSIRLLNESEGHKNMTPEEREESSANIFDTQVIMENNQPFLAKRKSKYGYALDGDVSNFGRKDFFDKRLLVAEELGINLGDPEIKKKFYKFAIELLKNHEWKTESARIMRQAQKEENIRQAEKEFSEIIEHGIAS